MAVPDSASPVRLRRRAIAALVIGGVGLMATVWGALAYRADGTLPLAAGADALRGREALAVVVGLGAASVAFCLYGLVLAWVARRLGALDTEGNGDRS